MSVSTSTTTPAPSTPSTTPPDQPTNGYMYTNYCVPDVKASALHLAAYNGRTATFRRLLAEPTLENVYRCTADRHYSSPLTVALARGQAEVADVCLEHLERDLACVAGYFEAIGGEVFESRFWLRKRILIALGDDHIAYVRQHSAGLEFPAADWSPKRSGLIILLKPTNSAADSVLWLCAPRPGEDRRLATIVAHICTRGAEIHLLRAGVFRRTDFAVAARQKMHAAWHKMYAVAGRWLLERRALCNSFRMLSEHADEPEAAVRTFQQLCRDIGGFGVEELFDKAQPQLAFDVLHDALSNYTGDRTLLDYLMETAAAEHLRQNPEQCADLQAARRAVFNQQPQRETDETLFNASFGFSDNLLPWHCVSLGLDLLGDENTIDRLLTHPLASKGAEVHRGAHALICEQFGEMSEYARQQCVRLLCRLGWLETMRELVGKFGAERVVGTDAEKNRVLVMECSREGSWEVAEFLIVELQLDADERLRIVGEWLRYEFEELGDKVPESLWTRLLVGQTANWSAELVDEALCQALKNRHWAEFERIWGRFEESRVLKDARDSDRTPILFHAIYDHTCLKDYYFPGRPGAMPSEEHIDDEDDDESSAAKRAANATHLAYVPEWKPATPDLRPGLAEKYDRLFGELLAAASSGADLAALRNVEGQSLLHVAVLRDNVAAVRQLLALGLPASAEDATGKRPMTYARSPVVIGLLPAADVRQVSESSVEGDEPHTPLSYYLTNVRRYYQSADTVAAFLAAGADPNHRLADGSQSLLHDTSLAVGKLLIEAGADVNAQNSEGQTPLLSAARQHCSAYEPEHEDWLVYLLQCPGIDVTHQTPNNGPSILAELLSHTERVKAALLAARPGFGDPKRVEQWFRERGQLAELARRLRSCEPSPVKDRLEHLPELLEDARVGEDLTSFDAQWTWDQGRFLLEAGAHVSERKGSGAPLSWPEQMPEDFYEEVAFLAANGANLEFRGGSNQTVLQIYAEDSDHWRWTQTRRVAALVAAGAKYRLPVVRGYGGKARVLDGQALECLYEKWN